MLKFKIISTAILSQTGFYRCRTRCYTKRYLLHKSYNNNYLNIPTLSYVAITDYKSSNIIPYNLSDIGEGIKEVALKEWFIKVGDKVKQFDNICEVQSDKASVTITSRYDGKISKLYKQVDDIVQVGGPLVDIEIEMKSRENDEKLLSPSSDYKNSSTEKFLPKLDDNKVISNFEREPKGVLAIPMVRKMAKDLGVNDLSIIPGTGKDGRITETDIQNYAQGLSRPSHNVDDPCKVEKIKGIRKAMIKTMTETMKIPQFIYTEEIDVRNLLNLKKSLSNIINHLSITKWNNSQHGRHGAEHKTDFKLTLLPFFIKSLSMTLTHFPILNGRFNELDETITYQSQHNVGVAMDSSQGLIVPNLKSVQCKSVLEITLELLRLTELCKGGKLGPADLGGGTFTLSNIGSIGGIHAKPLILPPEVAICAMGKTRSLPRYKNVIEEKDFGKFRIKNQDSMDLVEKVDIMNISVAADHRIIDGATVARFINYWKDLLEHPSHMLLDLR